MRYKNNRTGAVLDSSFIISGKDWVEVDGVEEKTTKANQTAKESELNFSEMTKNELIDYAEENNVEISSNDTKAEIIAKLEG